MPKANYDQFTDPNIPKATRWSRRQHAKGRCWCGKKLPRPNPHKYRTCQRCRERGIAFGRIRKLRLAGIDPQQVKPCTT